MAQRYTVVRAGWTGTRPKPDRFYRGPILTWPFHVPGFDWYGIYLETCQVLMRAQISKSPTRYTRSTAAATRSMKMG